MKKLILILLLSLGPIGTGTAFAHLEDVIVCQPRIETIYTDLQWQINFELTVVAQNNTDSSHTAVSVGIFSPSGEIESIHEASAWPAVDPGSTGTYSLYETFYMGSITNKEESEFQPIIDHNLKIYADKYKDPTCKIFGYN